jgi:hypothetical protein
MASNKLGVFFIKIISTIKPNKLYIAHGVNPHEKKCVKR